MNTAVSAACCPHCQRPLPPDAPRGLCPVCLTRVAIAPFAEDAPDPLAVEAAPRVGDYELIQELGRGASGRVWRARQASLNREVALKLLAVPALGDEEARRRFHREAQAIAALRHPHIVQIHEVGEHEGRPFFSMELMAGGNLSNRLRGGLPAPRQAAGWLRALAGAAAHAHSRGIVHRDIKPSNILLDQADAPFLTDFGLAKLLGADSDLTLTGLAVGSAQYMAPEQAEGRNELVVPAADIHALGGVLYQMLTGRPPFLADTLAATLKQVVETEPVAPRKLNPSVPRDLETICLKCLEKLPARRYGSAHELAGDLQRFLDGHPIRARAVTLLERAWRACRRRPLVSALAAGLILAVMGGVAGVTVQWRKTRAANETLKASALRSQVGASINLLEQTPLHGLDGLAKVLREAPAQRGAAARLLAALTEEDFPLPVGVLAHPAEVRAAVFSPDARRVATACADHQLRLWDAQRFTLLAGPRRFETPLTRLQFSDDGQGLLVVGGAMGAELVHPDTLERRFAPPATNAIVEADLSRDGRTLFTRLSDGAAAVWQVPCGRCVLTLSPDQAVAAALSPDGSRLAAAGTNPVVQVWQLPDGQPACAPWTVAEPVTTLRFAPDNLRVAIVMPSQVRIWQVPDARPRGYLPVREAPAQVDFSPDGQRLLVIEGGRTPNLYDAYTGRQLTASGADQQDTFPGQAFTPDGQRFVVRDDRARFCLLTTAEGRQLSVPVRWPETIQGFAICPTGRRLIALGGVAALPVWDISAGKAWEAWTGHTNSLRSLRFSPDGRRILTASADHTAQLWDARTLLPAAPALRHNGEVASARFSADGRRVLTASLDGTARVWDAQSAQPLGPVLNHAAPVHVAEFSPDGQTIGTVTADGTPRFWNPGTGELLVASAPASESGSRSNAAGLGGDLPSTATVSPPSGNGRVSLGEEPDAAEDEASVRSDAGASSPGPGAFCSGQFSVDGRRFVLLRRTGQAELWDVTTRRLIAPLPHRGLVTAAAFSADGRHVATASRDSTVRLWDAATGAPFGHPLVHESEVHCLAFGPADLLASGGLDRRPRVWRYLTAFEPVHLGYEQDSIGALAFSPDGARLAIRTATRTGRVRDLSEGHRLTGGQHGHLTRNLAVAFSPDGRWLATGARGGTVRLHELPMPDGPAPPWLADLAEALSGARLGTGGNPHADLLRLRDQLRALPGDDVFARHARWFFADRAIRAISPNSPVTVPEHLQHLLDENTEASLHTAARLAPDDPRPEARLADWLSRHSAKRYTSMKAATEFHRRRAAELEALAKTTPPAPAPPP